MLIFNLYKVGDTLIFHGYNREIESFTIIKKGIRYNGLSERYSGNPETCWIEYQTIPPGDSFWVSSALINGKYVSRYSVNKPFLNGTKWKEDKPARIEI